jgi:hypothetical protein
MDEWLAKLAAQALKPTDHSVMARYQAVEEEVFEEMRRSSASGSLLLSDVALLPQTQLAWSGTGDGRREAKAERAHAAPGSATVAVTPSVSVTAA